MLCFEKWSVGIGRIRGEQAVRRGTKCGDGHKREDGSILNVRKVNLMEEAGRGGRIPIRLNTRKGNSRGSKDTSTGLMLGVNVFSQIK